MKYRAMLASLLLIAAMPAAPAVAQSLTGTWIVSSEGRRGPQTGTLTLAQDGSALTGTISLSLGGRRGGGGGEGGSQTIDLEDGTVDGDSFSFSFTITFGDNSFEQSYSGTFLGNPIEPTTSSKGSMPCTTATGIGSPFSQ